MGKHRQWDITAVSYSLHYDPDTGYLHDWEFVERPSAQLLLWLRENKHPLKQWRKFARPADIIREKEINPLPVGKPCKRTGALIVYRGNQQFYAHVIAWLKSRGTPPVDGIAHLNGDRTDNRSENLASVLEVARAKKKPYRAVLRRGRDVMHLGYYPSKEERDTVVGLARLGVFPSGSK